MQTFFYQVRVQRSNHKIFLKTHKQNSIKLHHAGAKVSENLNR